MLAEGGGAPFDSNTHLFDAKWDGLRSIAFFGPGVHLQARSLRDQTPQFPELAEALSLLRGSGVLDGEIVVLEEERASFPRVMERNRLRDVGAIRRARSRIPAWFVAFDLMAWNGEVLIHRRLEERRAALDRLLPDRRGTIFPNPLVVGAGIRFFAEMGRRGLEGMVAKRLDSRYRIGERSGDWLKIKVRPTTSCVVFGTLHRRTGGAVRSLVVGAFGPKGAVWLGNVGSGLDEATRRRLGDALARFEAPPPSGFDAEGDGVIRYVRPLLVARVEYLELTPGGRLRHPVFLGFEERDPSACRPPGRSRVELEPRH